MIPNRQGKLAFSIHTGQIASESTVYTSQVKLVLSGTYIAQN